MDGKMTWRKRAIVTFLMLTLVATLCLGCGDDGEDEGKVTITIGLHTDLTGPAAYSCSHTGYGIEDMIRYYNEEGLIPGVKIELATYNNMVDPARDIPGYEWLRGRGAKVIIAMLHTTAEVLKPYAERDEVVVLATWCTVPMVDPPGWSFCFAYHDFERVKAHLKWISEEHWDYGQGIPKVGFVSWDGPSDISTRKGMKEYCQAHPDKFEWVGGFLAPVGTMTWSGEVEKLKDCDYIHLGPVCIQEGAFMRQFQARGYTTTFIGDDALGSCRGFLVDMLGWDALDGALSACWTRWWNDTYPIIELTEELLHKYRPGQAEDIIHSGQAYIGGAHHAYLYCDILRRAVEKVGAENFDGQAFYDVAVDFRMTWEGYQEISFCETCRDAVDYTSIYEWRDEAGDLVRVSDWLPVGE